MQSHGPLGPLVRAADGEWDPASAPPAMLAGVLVAGGRRRGLAPGPWRRDVLVGLCLAVIVLIAAPPSAAGRTERRHRALVPHERLDVPDRARRRPRARRRHPVRPRLQAAPGSSASTRPRTTAAGSPQAALDHFAYFPGTAVTATAWRLLPAPLDDYRLFVLLATLGALPRAALRGAARRAARGGGGAGREPAARGGVVRDGRRAEPRLPRARVRARARRAGGSAPRPARRRDPAEAIRTGRAPLLRRAAPRPPAPARRRRAAAASAGPAGRLLPFLSPTPALWDDTIGYGTGTYRILGYGFSALLLNAGSSTTATARIRSRSSPRSSGLPVTAWLPGRCARASREAAAGFAVSMLVLLFIARVFQTSHLVWPLTGVAITAVLAAGDRERSGLTRTHDDAGAGSVLVCLHEEQVAARIAAPGGRAAPACRCPSGPRTASGTTLASVLTRTPNRVCAATGIVVRASSM